MFSTLNRAHDGLLHYLHYTLHTDVERAILPANITRDIIATWNEQFATSRSELDKFVTTLLDGSGWRIHGNSETRTYKKVFETVYITVERLT